MVLIVVAVVCAVLAPVFARLLYFAASRRREYLADASAAVFTRYPEGLASALEKITSRHGRKMKHSNRVIAPLYTVNPHPSRALSSLFATHPPTERRVKVLRSMAGHVGYREYQRAFEGVEGADEKLLGKRTLAESQSAAVRAPTKEPAEKKGEEVAREVSDLLSRFGEFLVMRCTCGLGIKLPPEFAAEEVKCPRCGREHRVPKAQPKKVEKPTEPSEPQENATYARRTNGWESFQCSCGHSIHLSPTFQAKFVKCPKCKRKTEIEHSRSAA